MTASSSVVSSSSLSPCPFITSFKMHKARRRRTTKQIFIFAVFFLCCCSATATTTTTITTTTTTTTTATATKDSFSSDSIHSRDSDEINKRRRTSNFNSSSATGSLRSCDPCAPLLQDLWLSPTVPARHANLTKACPRLEDHLGFIDTVPQHNSWCLEIQTLSELCGKCAIKENNHNHDHSRGPTCTLCGRREATTANTDSNQKHEIPMEYPDKPLPVSFSHPFQNQVPTCQNYDLYLNSMQENSPICSSSQQFLQDYCGCQIQHNTITTTTINDSPLGHITNVVIEPQPRCQTCPHDISILDPSTEIRIPSLPFETCEELDHATKLMLPYNSNLCHLIQSISDGMCGCPSSAVMSSAVTTDSATTTTPSNNNNIQQKCTLCPDGSTVFTSSKLVPFLADTFQGIVPTCHMVHAYTLNFPQSSHQCQQLQRYGTYCGCPSSPDHCKLPCGGGGNTNHSTLLQDEFRTRRVEHYNSKGQIIGDTQHSDGNNNYKNNTIGNLQVHVEPTCEALYWSQFQMVNNSTECHTAISQTWQCGCDEISKPWKQTEPHTGALVTIPRIVGVFSMISCFIVMAEIASARTKRSNAFYQLVLWMSIFDCMTAVVWIVGPNPSSCRTQGFFRQWGQTSIFLTVSLLLFYYLVIIRGWKEGSFRSLQRYMLGIPLFMGTIWALVAIPSIRHYPFGCMVNVSSNTGKTASVLGFITIPIFLSTHAVVILMGSILEKKSPPTAPLSNSATSSSVQSNHRRQGSRDTKAELEGEAVWQGIWFTIAYMITWPIWGIAVFFNAHNVPNFWQFVILVAPLSGITNAFTYFWPRIVDETQRRRQGRKRRRRYNGDDHDDNVIDYYNPSDESSSSCCGRRFRRFLWRIVKGTKFIARKAGEITGQICMIIFARRPSDSGRGADAASRQHYHSRAVPGILEDSASSIASVDYIDGHRSSVLDRRDEDDFHLRKNKGTIIDKDNDDEDDEWTLEMEKLGADKYGFDDITGLLRPVV